MELQKSRFEVKCELGECKNKADYSIRIKRLGTRGDFHLCEQCMKELYDSISKIVIPKSPPNALGNYQKKHTVAADSKNIQFVNYKEHKEGQPNE